jgi:hypothetical protein
MGVAHLRQTGAALGQVHFKLAEGDVGLANLVADQGEALARVVAIGTDVGHGD